MRVFVNLIYNMLVRPLTICRKINHLLSEKSYSEQTLKNGVTAQNVDVKAMEYNT